MAASVSRRRISGAAERRRFAVGQIEDADRGALGFESEDGAAHAELGVVGVGGDHQVIERHKWLQAKWEK